MTTINLGIVAHVDAGKTSLTERILYETHVIDEIGRVDAGTTQTDSLELERRRGITIKASVVSFRVGDLKVNLIDTPGHADFVAEVERSLMVLDGAVLVLSAVEGIQAQTRVLFAALAKLRIPTILFINKIDRMGAQAGELVQRIRTTLTPRAFPFAAVSNVGTSAASVPLRSLTDAAFRQPCIEHLALTNDELLADYIGDEHISDERIQATIREQIACCDLYPILFGSAITGAGVSELLDAVARLFPSQSARTDAPLSGLVFKLETDASGEEVAYVRLFAGNLRVKQCVPLHWQTRQGIMAGMSGKVQRLHIFADGHTHQTPEVPAGELCKVWGLRDARIGDMVGDRSKLLRTHSFATPHFEVRVSALRPEQQSDLYRALCRLAREDPLVGVLRDDVENALYLRYVGEVQREVIATTLLEHFGIATRFGEASVVCVEKPSRAGEAVDYLGAPENPFLATVGFRVQPGSDGSGVTYAAPTGALKLAYYRVIEETARATLAQGLYGWEVTDVDVTLTQTGRIPSTTGSDFRSLVPLVLMAALARAGTKVYEPVNRFELSVPAFALGTALYRLSALGGEYEPPLSRGDMVTVAGTLPLPATEHLHRSLPGFTEGLGSLIANEGGLRPVEGRPPRRPRRDLNPLNRKEYLMRIQRIV